MNYLLSWLGYNFEQSQNEVNQNTINFIQYFQFSQINENLSAEKMYIHSYTNNIRTFEVIMNVNLSDGTIIDSGFVVNTEHFIEELIKTFPTETKLFDIVKTDLNRSKVTFHTITNSINDFSTKPDTTNKHITDILDFIELLTPYNKYYMKTNKVTRVDTNLSKLILCFCNQCSQVPMVEYANNLFNDKYLFHPNDGIVNYDIILDNFKYNKTNFSNFRILLQASVVKKIVSDLNNLHDKEDPEIIFVTSIILHCDTKTHSFTVNEISLLHYDANEM